MKTMIPMARVSSSNVHSRGYDRGTQTLAIMFKDKNGNPTDLVHYSNVTPELNEQLSTADSFGSALRSLIIKNKDDYPFIYIDQELAKEVAALLASDDAAAIAQQGKAAVNLITLVATLMLTAVILTASGMLAPRPRPLPYTPYIPAMTHSGFSAMVTASASGERRSKRKAVTQASCTTDANCARRFGTGNPE